MRPRGWRARRGVSALDVTEPTPASGVAACRERFGTIDALVNSAGMSEVKSLEQLTDDEWQAKWDLHVMAPMRLMRAAIPEMARAGWGRIVNVCSSSGKRPSKTNVAYSVTKAAQLSLSRAFADEYAGSGVLVNAVAPGPVASELWLAPGGMADQAAAAQGKAREEVLAATGAGAGRAHRRAGGDRLGDRVPVLGEASDVAGAAWSVDGGAVPVII